MKVLLLGDASNYHWVLATGLRRLGHDVTVASDGSRWMGTQRDIDISRLPGKAGGALLWLKLTALSARSFRGYDVVQLSNPVFLNLRPHRVRAFFDKIKKHNGSVFLTMLGTDTAYARMYAASDPADLLPWLQPVLSDHCQYVYDNIDGAVSALYEYHKAAQSVMPGEKLAYGGIPIEVPQGVAIRKEGPLRIICACHKGRETEKGIDKLWPVVQCTAKRRPGKVEATLVQNAPFEQFTLMLDGADVVVDQLYSETPATTALMAMARGKAVVSGATGDYYDFIGEKAIRPILHAEASELETLEEKLLHLIDHPAEALALGAQGREFVIKHNSTDVVARRFSDFWERIIQ